MTSQAKPDPFVRRIPKSEIVADGVESERYSVKAYYRDPKVLVIVDRAEFWRHYYHCAPSYRLPSINEFRAMREAEFDHIMSHEIERYGRKRVSTI